MPIPLFFRKVVKKMFECAKIMLIQLIQAMPFLIGLYILFDLLGGLFFGKK